MFDLLEFLHKGMFDINFLIETSNILFDLFFVLSQF